MNWEMIVVFGVLIIVAVLFVSNRLRSDLVAIMALLALTLSGALTLSESLAGFSDPVVMVILSMFIVSGALVNTGITQRLGEFVLKAGSGSETRMIVLLMLAVGLVGAFMNSTAAVAIFLPVILTVAEKASLNPKRLLMPLSVGALASGMMTLISTAPNLVIDNVLKANNLESFGFFSFTPFGISVLLVSIIYMLLAGRRMLAREEKIKSQKKDRSVRDLVTSYGLYNQVNSVQVLPGSSIINQTVSSLEIKHRFGLLIIGFEKHRSGKPYFIHASPETIFESGDEFLAIGSQEGANRLIDTHNLKRLPLRNERKRQKFLQEVGIAEVMLAPESNLIGRTLQDTQFRSRYNATVVAIRRRGEPITEVLNERKLDFGDALLVSAGWPEILRLRDESENFVVLSLPKEFHEISPARKRAPLSLAIIGAMVIAMSFHLLPTATAAMLAALVLIITKCVKLESIYKIISWQSVVLIAGILPLATALNKSGAAHLISVGMVDTLGRLGPLAMLVLIFVVTAVAGFFISNTATAVLIAPIAVDAAIEIGASPHAFAMTVAIACSAAYVTPVSSPVNMLVQEPGDYAFMDYVKVGLPLLFLSLIVTVLLIGFLYIY